MVKKDEEVIEEPTLEDLEDEEAEEELLYAVKVDGSEQEVTLDELMKGYSRQSDYTKKTQELAEGRKAIEQLYAQYNSEIHALQQERQQYMDTLTNIISNQGGELEKFANVDWDALRENDPIEYVTTLSLIHI